jgi:Alanine racemase, N-terminal domain
MAVVKADGYGHGSIEIAKTAINANYEVVCLIGKGVPRVFITNEKMSELAGYVDQYVI